MSREKKGQIAVFIAGALVGLPALLALAQLPAWWSALASQGIGAGGWAVPVLLAAGAHWVARRAAWYRFGECSVKQSAQVLMAYGVLGVPRKLTITDRSAELHYDVNGPFSEARRQAVALAPFWLCPITLGVWFVTLVSGRPQSLGTSMIALASWSLVIPLAHLVANAGTWLRGRKILVALSAAWLWLGVARLTVSVLEAWSWQAIGRDYAAAGRLLCALLGL